MKKLEKNSSYKADKLKETLKESLSGKPAPVIPKNKHKYGVFYEEQFPMAHTKEPSPAYTKKNSIV